MVDVTNRLKGLDLINRVSEALWMEVCDIVQEAMMRIIPQKNVVWFTFISDYEI